MYPLADHHILCPPFASPDGLLESIKRASIVSPTHTPIKCSEWWSSDGVFMCIYSWLFDPFIPFVLLHYVITFQSFHSFNFQFVFFEHYFVHTCPPVLPCYTYVPELNKLTSPKGFQTIIMKSLSLRLSPGNLTPSLIIIITITILEQLCRWMQIPCFALPTQPLFFECLPACLPQFSLTWTLQQKTPP